jgi:hypothetical protein
MFLRTVSCSNVTLPKCTKKRTARRKQDDLEREERIRIPHSTPGSRSRAEEYMETSFMSESAIDADNVEETVTQVLTQFVQDGGEQAAMSVQLLQEQVELHLTYDG